MHAHAHARTHHRTHAAPKRTDSVDGPAGYPFFGNMAFLVTERHQLQETMLECAHTYGKGFTKTWGITGPRLGSFGENGRALFLTTPECVRHVI